jgi:peptidyl-prolyl cis-trans isomerase C
VKGGSYLFRFLVNALCVVALFGLIAGCAEETEVQGLARIGNKVVTEEDVRARMESMPPFMQEQLSTPEGRERLLKGIVEEEIIRREALALGLDKTEEYKEEMERRKTDTLIRLFYDQVLEAEARPTEQEVADYYREHPEEFVEPEKATGRHILVETEAEAKELKGLVDEGANFSALAADHSIDTYTGDRGGIIPGELVEGENVKGLGAVPELVEAALALEVGEVSDPVKTKHGWHIFMSDGHEPEKARPLDQVREDIVSRITFERRTEVRDEKMEELRRKYDVEYLDSVGEPQTPEDLFKTASEESNPSEKIRYYRMFAERYPDNERAYEADFMIGFVMAEELKDYEGARAHFEDFLARFPDSDLSDDAGWMLENMESDKQPEFQEEDLEG